MAAATGAEGIAALQDHHPAVVITDVIMPRMNGMEMYRRMREIVPDLKVIFASGYSADIIQEKGRASGEYRFLQKPLKRETLLVTLREVLEGGTRFAGMRDGRSRKIGHLWFYLPLWTK